MMATETPTVPYPKVVKPTLTQRLEVFMLHHAVKAFVDKEHFKTPTAIYIFKCPEGHWVLDYLHGSPTQQYLNCPSSMSKTARCQGKGCAGAHIRQEQTS